MKKLYIVITIAIVALGGWWIYSNQSKQPFSTNISSVVAEAREAQVVNLKNGDIYSLTAGIVKKNIGGNEMRMLAYNGSIPGPIIKVSNGVEVTINFTNNTDVPTTIHSHGVRLDNKFDGVPDVTQKEVGVEIGRAHV